MPLEKKKTCSTHQTGENSRLNQCAKNDKSGETFGKKSVLPTQQKVEKYQLYKMSKQQCSN
jgi:hypothetical protein